MGMKNAVLVAQLIRKPPYKNIGDYIQSLAGKIFFDTVDEYIERDKLSEYKSESGNKAKMIMNAWYMKNPENWPPSDDILPLLISMRISPSVASRMMTAEGINYLKKYGPVGCRDKYTEALLKQHDIPCYFSACLTLVLGEKYKTHHKKNRILFVDPYFEFTRLLAVNSFKSLCYGIVNYSKIKQLQKIFNHNKIISAKRKKLENILSFVKVSAFYKTYSSSFDDSLLLNAEYITHRVKVGENTPIVSVEEKIDYAESLIRKYAEASLVITSMLHCALPCVGLETPVIFTTDEDGNVRQKGRFGGIIELFDQIAYVTKNRLVFKEHKKTDYVSLKNALIKRVKEFIQQDTDDQ